MDRSKGRGRGGGPQSPHHQNQRGGGHPSHGRGGGGSHPQSKDTHQNQQRSGPQKPSHMLILGTKADLDDLAARINKNLKAALERAGEARQNFHKCNVWKLNNKGEKKKAIKAYDTQYGNVLAHSEFWMFSTFKLGEDLKAFNKEIASKHQAELRSFGKEFAALVPKLKEADYAIPPAIDNIIHVLQEKEDTVLTFGTFHPLEEILEANCWPILQGKEPLYALIGWENSFVGAAFSMGYPPKFTEDECLSFLDASLPGGGKDESDSAEIFSTVKREFKEETGLTIPSLFDLTKQKEISKKLGFPEPKTDWIVRVGCPIYVCYYSSEMDAADSMSDLKI